jgi:hypothetical protein
MVRTDRWRVLLAATLLGVVLIAPPALAQDTSSGTATTVTTAFPPEGSTPTTAPTSSTTGATTTTVDARSTVPTPKVVGPIAADVGTKGHPLAAAVDPLKAAGYVEHELFVEGSAVVHGQAGTWGTDGRWAVSNQATVPYRTRVLVRRPIDPSRFDGTVVVSWLNVSGAFEIDPEWAQAGDELMREGAVFVGVSAQTLGIDGPLGARRWDPDRYADLTLPGDSLSYDVFSQVAKAIRTPKGVDLLGGLSTARRLIASGQSQSAQRLVTYLNAFQPTTHMFDGFLLVSRFRGAAPLGRTLLPQQGALDPDGSDASHPFFPDPLAALLSGPPRAQVRADTTVPVFTVITETEAAQDAAVRRPDSALYRTWEVAGSSHVDATSTAATVAQLQRDFPKAPLSQIVDCAAPNTFPTRYALRAALHSLSSWVADGTPPATAPSLRRDPATGALVRDAAGNVLGGLRLPQIDVPTATHTGLSDDDGYYCGLAGHSTPFSAADLAARYPTPTAYTDAVAAASAAAVSAGHLLPDDAAEIVAASRGGATEASIDELIAPPTTKVAVGKGNGTGKGEVAAGSAAPAAGSGDAGNDPSRVTAAASSHAQGWLATTGRDLITPLLIGLLLLINGRVVLTVAHQRRSGSDHHH